MFFKKAERRKPLGTYPFRYTRAVSPGTLIRRARTDAGLTQQTLAERAGTSQATLSAYERNHKDPSAATLFRILAATGMRLTTAPAPVVVTPSREVLRRRGQTLDTVLELAEALPARHGATLAYPPLATLIGPRRG